VNVDNDPEKSEYLTDFASWYSTEAPRAVLALTAALADHGLAEECVAEAFARAYAQWKKVSVMDSPNGWIYVVALNHARSAERKRRRERQLSNESYSSSAMDPPDVPDPIWDAVRELSPQARRAIALRYIADLPETEIARAMGVTRGTVATTLQRARRALAERLDVAQKETSS
jgi:RNA polymerase sigma-70 factor (ECF subfamily)